MFKFFKKIKNTLIGLFFSKKKKSVEISHSKAASPKAHHHTLIDHFMQFMLGFIASQMGVQKQFQLFLRLANFLR